MKNFLAVDTGSKYMTVLVVKDGKKTVVFEQDCSMRHSVKLMNAVDRALKESGAAIGDFDFFACAVGAGSFTGIRIGISTVKGFALATGKPVLPVTSFDVGAYNVEEADLKKVNLKEANAELNTAAQKNTSAEKILVLSDALHGAYYVCGYGEDKAVVYPPAYLMEADVLALTAAGYLPVAVEKTLLGGEEVTVVDPAEGLYKAVCALAERAENFKEPKALYIRKSQAEINLEAEGKR